MILRIALALLVTGLAVSQETCRHCPVDLNEQFPEAPESEQRQRIFTKSFIGAELVHASAISFDAYETVSREGHGCLEGSNGFPERVSGKELAGEGIAEFGVGLLFGMAIQHSHPPKAFKWMAYMAPAYGAVLHLRGGIEWITRCN